MVRYTILVAMTCQSLIRINAQSNNVCFSVVILHATNIYMTRPISLSEIDVKKITPISLSEIGVKNFNTNFTE